MRQSAVTIGMAAIVAVACTSAPTNTYDDGRLAVRHVDLAHLPEEAAHPAPTDIGDTGNIDPRDPMAVSLHAVGAAVRGRGLTITDIGSHLEDSTEHDATVRVLVTHRAERIGALAEQTTIYLLELHRGLDGRWTVADRRLVR